MRRRGRGGCGASPDWTAQGELLGKHLGGSTTSYVTDSLGRLQSVTLPTGHVVSYVYDGSNRRVGKKVDGVLQQGFLYRDAIKPVVELDGAGNVVSRFVYGSNPITPDYVVKGGSTYKIFSDQIGSPRVVVDVSSGSIVERIDYDERGNTLNDTNPGFIPFGFTGGIVDRDTGLIRFGARDYDPSVGRWTTKDGIGFNGGSNFYAYAGDDATNRVDPSGHDPFILAGAAIGFFGDIGYQLATNGGRFSCVDWTQVAIATGTGALVGAIGPAALEGDFWAGLVTDTSGGVGGKLGALVPAIQAGFAAAAPTTAFEALDVIASATASVGLEPGIAALGESGEIVLTNVGGITTTLGTDGSILIERAGSILLSLPK